MTDEEFREIVNIVNGATWNDIDSDLAMYVGGKKPHEPIVVEAGTLAEASDTIAALKHVAKSILELARAINEGAALMAEGTKTIESLKEKLRLAEEEIESLKYELRNEQDEDFGDDWGI